MQHAALYPALVTCLALLLYVVTALGVARARRSYGIDAPTITGDPAFERRFRVHQNMAEALILFLPSLWIFSLTIAPLIGLVLGLLFVLARIWYSVAYTGSASARTVPFVIAQIISVVLLIGALFGTIRAMLAGM